jgi:hypothetical protein
MFTEKCLENTEKGYHDQGRLPGEGDRIWLACVLVNPAPL